MSEYCFVITSYVERDDLMELQKKSGLNNLSSVGKINFGDIYTGLIQPAIIRAELEPLLEKQEQNYGNVHTTMYEKILLCEFCIADLTHLNPNVYYELGMRYAVKPFSTIPIIASSHFPLPFDVYPDRAFVYQVDDKFNLSNRRNDIDSLADILIRAKKTQSTHSSLYDLINGMEFQNSVAHEKTDIFRERVRYNKEIKIQLAKARSFFRDRNDKAAAIQKIQHVIDDNQPLENVETAVLIDIMISFRNIEAFPQMQKFIESLPRYVSDTVMVREQYAFVLNRNGGKAAPLDSVMIQKAEDILSGLQAKGKASSESYGIWGRIHKDKFDRAYKAGDKNIAKVHLKDALNYYRKGFESDPRDAYPGVNYVTCLELLGEKERALRLVSAVEYAVFAKIKRKKPDYWDNATLLELAVIENKFEIAQERFYQAKPLSNEKWMLGTTNKNLQLIKEYRRERGEDISEIDKIIHLFSEGQE